MIDTGVPLGIRIYDLVDGVDIHVTRFTEDFSFRCTAPGGYASSTLKIKVPEGSTLDPALFGKLFYRVQIFDKRSAEILWEGRVEDPATQVEENAWEIGVLGSQVAANDVRMPALYIDNTVENWRTTEADAWTVNIDTDRVTMEAQLKPGYVWTAGNEYDVLVYNGLQRALTTLGRFSCTYKGAGPGAQAANYDMLAWTSDSGNFDQTAFNAAQVYKSNPVGGAGGLVTTGFDFGLTLAVRKRTGTGNYTIGASEEGLARFKWPKVVGLRMDENGNSLIASTDYANDYIYAWQVVKDVVGRFLNGGWLTGGFLQWLTAPTSRSTWNNPEQGSVRGIDAYINTDGINKISNLWWLEATTAKEILDTMMIVQPDCYWAIWDSGHRFGQGMNDPVGVREHQFRFEWSKWSDAPVYFASSQDGMAQQLMGDDLYNAGTLAFEDPENFITTTGVHMSTTSTTVVGSTYPWEVEELKDRFTRMMGLSYPDVIVPGDFSGVAGETYLRKTLADQSEPKNTGTITIRRRILMRDDGEDSAGGFAGMIDPWEIRPGKLIKITDIWPNNNAGEMAFEGFLVTLNANVNFETAGPTGWTGTFGTLTRANDQIFSGSFSGKFVPNGVNAGPFVATDWQRVTEFEYYRFSAWVRCAVAREILLQMDWYNDTPTSKGTSLQTVNVAANTWTFISFTAQAPEDATQGPMLIRLSGTPTTSHIVWMDEARFDHVVKPKGHENCVFRVVATEYNTSDNSCKLELDTLPRWNLATQVNVTDAPGNLKIK